MKKSTLGLIAAGLIAGSGLEAKAQTSVTPGANGWTNNFSVVWNWATQYMVKATSSGNGYITTNGVDSESYAPEGSNITFKANANSGYHFANWGGTPLTGNATNIDEITFPVDKPYTNITGNFVTNAVIPSPTNKATIFSFCMNDENNKNDENNREGQNNNYVFIDHGRNTGNNNQEEPIYAEYARKEGKGS